MVESCISGLVTPPGVNADFSTRRAFNCYLAARVDYRSPRDCSRSGNGHTLPILAVLLLTLIAIGGWLLRIRPNSPAYLRRCSSSAALRFSFWSRQAGMPPFNDDGIHTPKLFGDITDPGNLSVQLPALSAALPFLLLIMVTLRLPLANPSPVFGLACC